MNSEFERLLELLYAPVTELLKEQENSDNTNNKLDLCVIPSIHQAGGQYDESVISFRSLLKLCDTQSFIVF